MKDIHIVFLNYVRKDDIVTALTSVFADIQECSYSVAITVVDNSQNQDGIREILRDRFPLVRYIDAGGNVGFGRGNNVGFKAEEARYYFALNPDTIIPDTARVIERIVKFMDEHVRIGGIGVKLVNMDDSLQYSCYRFNLSSILIKPLKHINLDKKYRWVKKHADKLEMKDFDHSTTRPVDWVLGAALVVRKEVVDQIGLFDERYFMYFEDCDWCHRMWDAGWSVYYVHDIVIKHAHARDSAKVPGIFRALFKNKLARIHAVSWIKYVWKWRNSHKYYATKL